MVKTGWRKKLVRAGVCRWGEERNGEGSGRVLGTGICEWAGGRLVSAGVGKRKSGGGSRSLVSLGGGVLSEW